MTKNKEPLTYYDMNLSAQDHQTFFTCEYDAGKPEYEVIQILIFSVFISKVIIASQYNTRSLTCNLLEFYSKIVKCRIVLLFYEVFFFVANKIPRGQILNQ